MVFREEENYHPQETNKLNCTSTYLEANLANYFFPKNGDGDGSLIKMGSAMQRNLLIA